MKTLTLLCIFLFGLNTVAQTEKQFPEGDRTYRPKVDVGFDQYRTESLKKSNKVVLTYDDGPHPTRTPKLLDLLKSENVKATFFILTRKVNKNNYPIIERILNEGHILASHDHDHDNNNGENEEEFKEELARSVLLLEELKKKFGSNQISSYYRFPYGAYGKNEFYHHFNAMKDVSNQLYNENCINFSFWDIDTSDWVPSITSEQISQNIMAHIKGGTAYRHVVKRSIFGKVKYKMKKYKIKNPIGGGIVLMHDIHERSIKASELFIRDAKKNGIEIVPLSEVKEYSYAEKTCVLK